jgi:predicted Rossmann-fold nucleotide-binding protein
VLNVNGYFDHFLKLLDHAVSELFVRPLHRAIVISDRDPETLLRRMMEYEAPLTGKWIDRTET